jgi:hypothetical protein
LLRFHVVWGQDLFIGWNHFMVSGFNRFAGHHLLHTAETWRPTCADTVLWMQNGSQRWNLEP